MDKSNKIYKHNPQSVFIKVIHYTKSQKKHCLNKKWQYIVPQDNEALKL